MGGGGGGGAGIVGSLGGVVGGLIGQSNASGYSSHASSEAGIADNIMQQMAAVPTIDQPLILQQYRQAGLLTPAMEQQIQLGVSQASQVKANPALAAAQNQALNQMAQRSQTGLTASDRAAFNQLQQQVGASTQGRLQAIQQQQQVQTGGQGTQGATLAAKLQAAQGGANTESLNADQLAAQASNNALQATAQYGGLAGQMNSQQFQQQMAAAQSADAFRQFDVQNQVAQQQRNTTAQNQAQQYNLNLAQNIGNANVSQANQAQYNQRQVAAQQWGMQDTQAVQQAQSAAGYGNTLSNMAQATQQAGANLGAGIGGIASQAMTPYTGSKGGEVPGYADGGQINDFANMSPIQLAQMNIQQQRGLPQFNMPQRGQMQADVFSVPGSSGSGSQKKKQQMGTTDNASDDQSISGNGLSNDTVDGSVVDSGDAYAGTAGDAASSAAAEGGGMDLAGLVGLAANKGGKIPRMDYRSGGHIPGKAPMRGDSPKNDIVPARLSPGEIVLPRSIAEKLKGIPDKDFNARLNKIVGPFIRKSQTSKNGKPGYDDGGQVNPDDPFGGIDQNSDIDPSHQMTGGDSESAADVIAASKNAQPQAKPNEAGADDSSSGSDGINAGNAPQAPLGGNNAGMQQAAMADAGSGAPPPRQQMQGANFTGPPQPQKSSGGGGGGGSIMSMLPMLAMLMSDGGEIPDVTDDTDSAWNRLKKNLSDQFAPAPTPKPTPTKEQTRDQEYEDIRRRSRLSVTDPNNPDAYSKGGKVSKKSALQTLKDINCYDDGGEVDDNAQYQKDMEAGYERNARGQSKPPQSDFEIETEAKEQRAATQRAKDRNPMNQPLSQANGPRYGYDEGGDVKKDDSQPADPDQPTPDTDDDGDDSAIVRANPDSNKEIDKLGDQLFAQNDQQDQDEDEPTDRNRAPADLEDVSKDGEDDRTPESEEAKTKAAEDAVLHPDEDDGQYKVISSDQTSDDGSKADITNDDVDKMKTASPTAVSDEEQPVKSVEDKLSQFQQQLKRAQSQRQALLAGAQGAKYGALLAAGIAGGHGAYKPVTPASPEYFNNSALAEAPVKNIAEQSQMEMDDPDSPISKFYRQRLKESLGTNIASDVPASGLKALFPQVTKIVAQDYARKIVKDKIQANAEQQDKNRQVKRDIAAGRNQTQQSVADKRIAATQGFKDQGEQDKIGKELNSLTASSRSVLGAAEMSRMRAERLKDIVANPNATPQDMNLAASELNTVVTNTSTVAGAKALEYRNLQTGIANLMQKITSNPHAPDVPQIKQHISDLADQMIGISKNVVDNNGARIKSSHTDWINKYPDRWENMLNAATSSPAAGVPQPPRSPQSIPVGSNGVPGGYIKKGYNSSTNQTQFVYPDGTKVVKDGKL
jgi:hypothetical protein